MIDNGADMRRSRQRPFGLPPDPVQALSRRVAELERQVASLLEALRESGTLPSP